MARHKLKNPRAIASIVLVSIGFPVTIVLLTLGGIFFFKEHPKALRYANSVCEVDRASYKVYECQSRYYHYACYGPTWNVHHGENRTISAVVEAEKRYRYYADALKEAHHYQINSSYSCWYDTRNPSIAQWNKPDTHLGIILLSCGGAAFLLTGMLLFAAIHLIKQEIAQSKHDDMDPYSYLDQYTKN